MPRGTRTTPGALPHQCSTAQSERAWIGLGLAAWTGSRTVWNGERPWRGRLGEAGDRAVPGRGDGDVIISKDRGSAVGTLVERATHCVRLLHRPAGHDAYLAGQAMGQAIITGPPPGPHQSPGTRAAKQPTHAGFIIATGIPVCCYRPPKPWPRGSNENTGPLRQYLPKGTGRRCTPQRSS
jgi:IS30 family transposase